MNTKTLALAVALALLELVAVSAAAANAEVEAAIQRRDYAAARKLLRTELATSPDDETTRFTLARVLGWSGDYPGALAQYDALLAAHPDNVDYVFGRAQVLSWSGGNDAALTALDRARTLAPEYEEVWRLELAVLERSGADAAVRLETFREAAARRFPDAAWWHRPPGPTHAAAFKTVLTAGTVEQSLSTAVPGWSSLFVELSRRRENGGYYASLTREQRFGSSDVVLGGGADWKLSDRWTLGAELALGNDTDFMPRAAPGVWALRAWPAGWETQLRLRYRDYGNSEVSITGATIARYFGNFRAAYSLDLAELDGTTTSAAHGAALDYYRSEHTRFNVRAVYGQEAESIGPGQVLRTDVRGISAGATHDLAGRFSLSWWIGTTRQGDFYRRRYVGVTLAADL